jgi:hypothetical protein
MRNTEKDRAKRNQRKQRLETKAKKLACPHNRRTATYTGNFVNGFKKTKLLCKDCGEVIVMEGVGVFGTSLDPSAKRNEAHRKNG